MPTAARGFPNPQQVIATGATPASTSAPAPGTRLHAILQRHKETKTCFFVFSDFCFSCLAFLGLLMEIIYFFFFVYRLFQQIQDDEMA